MNQTNPLYSPFDLGPMTLQNRLVMAPMTRCRAVGHLPNVLMARYYAQRSSAGLIVTEATQVESRSIGYPDTPGIHSPAQTEAWRLVTEAVHRAGGRIFAQLWHVGRIAHPAFPGAEAVAPSPIAAQGISHTPAGPLPLVVPRALGTEEIAAIVAAFHDGAANAKLAGFDGVEIHAANGYLVDQFLRDGSNRRRDAYGGTPVRRARFLLEVTRAALDVFGTDRVGVRLSPSGTFNDMRDSDPLDTFVTALRELSELPLAYVHVIEASESDLRHGATEVPTAVLRAAYRGRLMVNGGYDAARAEAVVRSGAADLVSFGTAFLANPDLPARLSSGRKLNRPDPETFYVGGARGYVDYPASA